MKYYDHTILCLDYKKVHHLSHISYHISPPIMNKGGETKVTI